MGMTAKPHRQGILGAVFVVLLLALLGAMPAFAHLEEEAGEGRAAASLKAQERGGGAALEERLGARIPLDAVFRDETGREVRLSEIVTVPTIILPVYYRCSNVCNFLQGDLARILPEIKRTAGEDYRVLSVSIDETETPAQAAGAKRMYLAAMSAPFPASGWRFLTGNAANIRRLTDAAGFRFQRRGTEFMHPVASFVVSGNGLIVRYLYGTSFLSKDVTLALVEAGEGRVGTTMSKLVGYCFSFDPERKSYQFNLLRVCATAVLLCCGTFFIFLVVTGSKKRHLSGGK